MGQKMSDYIIAGGLFEKKANELIQKGFRVNWESVLQTASRRQPSTGEKNKNKIKYTCSCKTNVWGKPGLKLICGECNGDFVSQDEN